MSWYLEINGFIIVLFSKAPVKNCHKLSGIKQQKFNILHFCSLENRNWSHWAKIKVLERLCSFLEALGDNLFLTLYSVVFFFFLAVLGLRCCSQAFSSCRE